jgi:DHA1 family tetracycline resistance protein-like MFS transporter
MQKKPLLVIFLTVFIDLVGFGIIIPLSPYLARTYGASPLHVGLLMAIFSTMQFLFSPVWGRISDRVGRRPVLLISIAGTALAHLLFYFASELVMLFVARALAGIFSANISTAMAYIADVTNEKDRSKNMGLIGAAFGLGFICGPVLGGVLSDHGQSFPALVAAGISAFNFFFAFFVLKESLSKENRRLAERKSRVKNIFEKLQRPVVGSLLFGLFAVSFSMANMEATLFLFVHDRFGWSAQLASYGFAYVGVCIALTQGIIVRKVLPRVGERWMLIWGFLFFSIGMWLTSVSHSITILAIAMTVLALGNGFVTPSLNGALSLLTSPKEQGEVLGVGHSLSALARIFGPPLGGFLYMNLGQPVPFVFAGLLGTIGFFIIWTQRQKIPMAGFVRQND